MEMRYKKKEDLFRFLKANKQKFIEERKTKEADAVSFHTLSGAEGPEPVMKASGDVHELLARDSITVRSIINTTNLLDSHGDVHIPGLWKKSLKEQKNLCLLREHRMTFDHIISESVSASAQKMTWKDLGFDFAGDTEALVFDSEIEKARNPYMFEQYARGYVKNHSVGMRYVDVILCIDSEEKDYKKEKSSWDKYIVEVVNRKEAEGAGYFWAVTEAKLIEGSAVVRGSNWATPVQSIKEYMEPAEAGHDIGQVSIFEKMGKLKIDLKWENC